jgi:hypothetical protein
MRTADASAADLLAAYSAGLIDREVAFTPGDLPAESNGSGPDRARCDYPVDWDQLLNGATTGPEWVYEDVLAAGRGHLIYAAQKSGKSMLAGFMAAAMAASAGPAPRSPGRP